MSWIADNWFLIVALLAFCGMAACAVIRFAGLPTKKQQEKIKEWLIWACIEVERELQSGTGQLKLREVWNKFCAVPAFTSIAKLITFDMFSGWVKNALLQAKEMLVKNSNLSSYVYGESANEEVQKIKKQISESSTL